jgi:hypothetical protein
MDATPDSMYYSSEYDATLLLAIAELQSYPIVLTLILRQRNTTTTIRCTNPSPLRSLGCLSEGIDHIEIEDRNATGASLEFGRFDVRLFVASELTDRIDCDTCTVETEETSNHSNSLPDKGGG